MTDVTACSSSPYTGESLLFTPADPALAVCEPTEAPLPASPAKPPEPANEEAPHDSSEGSTSAYKFPSLNSFDLMQAGAAPLLEKVVRPGLTLVKDVAPAATRLATVTRIGLAATPVVTEAAATTAPAAPTTTAATGSTALWGTLAATAEVALPVALLAGGAWVVSNSKIARVNTGPITGPGPSEQRQNNVGPYGGTLPPGGVAPQPDKPEPQSAPQVEIGVDFHGAGKGPLLVGFDEDPNGKRPDALTRGFLPPKGQEGNWVMPRTIEIGPREEQPQPRSMLPPGHDPRLPLQSPAEDDPDRPVASSHQAGRDADNETLSADTAGKDDSRAKDDDKPEAPASTRARHPGLDRVEASSFEPLNDGSRFGPLKLDALNVTEPRVGAPRTLIFQAERPDEFGPWGFARPNDLDPKSRVGSLSPNARTVGLELPFPVNYTIDGTVDPRHVYNLAQDGGLATAQAFTRQPMVPAGVETLEFNRPMPHSHYAIVFADTPVKVDDNTVRVPVSTYAVDKEWQGPEGMEVSLVSRGNFLYRLNTPNMSVDIKEPAIPTPPGLLAGAQLSGYLVPSTSDFTLDTSRKPSTDSPAFAAMWASNPTSPLGPWGFARPASSNDPKDPLRTLSPDARLVAVEAPGPRKANINGVNNGANTMRIGELGGLQAAQAWTEEPLEPAGLDNFKFKAPLRTSDRVAIFAEPPVLSEDGKTLKVNVKAITINEQGKPQLVSEGDHLYRAREPGKPITLLSSPELPTPSNRPSAKDLAPSATASRGEFDNERLLELADVAAAQMMRKYAAGPVTGSVTNLRYHDPVAWPQGATMPENVVMYASQPQIKWVEGKAPDRATVTVQGYAVDPANPNAEPKLVISADLVFVNFNQATGRPTPLVNVTRPAPAALPAITGTPAVSESKPGAAVTDIHTPPAVSRLEREAERFFDGKRGGP